MDWYDPRGELDAEGLRRLGAAFARLRSPTGFSQGALGDRIGLSQASISRFENGKQPGLRARWLARMLITLGAGPDELEAQLRPWRPGRVDIED